jgi:raffinose/stachyose/melibiose transport system substrate-binding protein
MRKLAATATALMMIATLLAACGGTPTAAPTSAPAAAQPTSAPAAAQPTSAPAAAAPTNAPAATASAKQNVTLTYIMSQGWNKDAELELGKKFEAETGIHVDYQIIPADQYFTVLQTKLNSNEGPDIFGGQSGKTDLKVNYNAEKNAVDLTNEEWVKREDPAAVNETTLDGKVYGLTIWDSSRWIIVYNKDIFQKLGLSVPKTYAEFKAVCQKIKDAGITPVFEPVSDGWHHVLWFPENGPRYEELSPGLKDKLNANQTTFAATPSMLQALQQLQEMYKLGYFGDNALSDAFADAGKNMASGKYAMVYANLNAPLGWEADFPETKATTFGFFVNPLDDNQISAFQPAGPSKFIYSGSKHIEEAKQYFRFLTKPENLQFLLDNTKDFTSLNFPEVKSKFNDEQKAFLAAYPKTGTVYQISVNYLNPQWLDIGKDLVAMFTEAMTPDDVLKSIDQRRADLAKTAKDPAWNK